MSVVDALPSVLQTAWRAHWGTVIDRVDALNLMPVEIDQLEDLIHVLEILSACETMGENPWVRLPEGIMSVTELVDVLDELYDDSILDALPEEIYNRRYPAEQETCEEIIQLIWTTVDKEAAPWTGKVDMGMKDILTVAEPIGEEPFDLYMTRAEWCLVGIDRTIGERLRAHVAQAALECFAAAPEDMPKAVKGWEPTDGSLGLRKQAPEAWAAIDDLGKATVRADRRMRNLVAERGPDVTIDISRLPTVSEILAEPTKTPIVLEGRLMRGMMARLLGAVSDNADNLDKIASYVKRFPMDFRATFVLYLPNFDPEAWPMPESFTEERVQSLDPWACQYVRQLAVPAPKGPGKLGSVG